MYLYKIGYWDAEKDYIVLLAHKQDIGKDRFEAIMYSAVESSIEKKLKKKEKLHCFKDIYLEVLDFLTTKHNFIALKVAQSWTCYGKASLFVEDYDVNADDTLKQLRKDLQQEGYGLQMDSEYSKYFKATKSKRRRKKDDKKN